MRHALEPKYISIRGGNEKIAHRRIFSWEKEVRGDDAGIVYDTHTENITIQVDDDGQENLTATSYVPSWSIVFENETKPGVLTVTKETDGSGTGDEVFIFDIYLTNEYGQALDDFIVVGGEQEW